MPLEKSRTNRAATRLAGTPSGRFIARLVTWAIWRLGRVMRNGHGFWALAGTRTSLSWSLDSLLDPTKPPPVPEVSFDIPAAAAESLIATVLTRAGRLPSRLTDCGAALRGAQGHCAHSWCLVCRRCQIQASTGDREVTG